MLSVRVGDTIRQIRQVHVRVDGILRLIRRISVRVNGNLVTVFNYFSAATNRSIVTGSYNGSSSAPQNITTSLVTVMVTGGQGPFTYQWEVFGVSAYTWNINAATNPTTSFTCLALSAGTIETQDFRCRVTDNTGAITYTNVVTAQVTNSSTA